MSCQGFRGREGPGQGGVGVWGGGCQCPGRSGAHLASQQEEAGAAEAPVHLQQPLGGGAGAGFAAPRGRPRESFFNASRGRSALP